MVTVVNHSHKQIKLFRQWFFQVILVKILAYVSYFDNDF